MNELRDEHYVRAVTELGDTHKIVTSQDIYSKNGVMLVASGVAITSKLYDRLVHHVLLKPLDLSLSSEQVINAETIWRDTQNLILGNSKLERMVDIIDKGFPLRKGILSIHLPKTLTFKLTVAREKYPDIYQRSLSILIMCVYLARCDGMSLDEEGYMIIAALFHDMGMLHINPVLLDPHHVMSREERRHLYAHPLTAYLFLHEFPELPRYIADAVLDHHERMDGRGYPRGLRGNKISRYAQILAIAEVSARALEPSATLDQWKKLEWMLKLNYKQFGSGLIGHLSVLRDGSDADVTVNSCDTDALVAQVRLIAKLLEDFGQYSDAGHSNEVYDFAQARLAGLRLELLEAGFDPHDPEELIQRFIDDPDCVPEYEPLLQETHWQLKTLVLDISRHWPEQERSKEVNYAWLGDIS
ncbi:MAG: HD domain-containing phosphohydrolase [Candidatus Nitrotoga sp.]